MIFQNQHLLRNDKVLIHFIILLSLINNYVSKNMLLKMDFAKMVQSEQLSAITIFSKGQYILIILHLFCSIWENISFAYLE